jgi:hypothetical protein
MRIWISDSSRHRRNGSAHRSQQRRFTMIHLGTETRKSAAQVLEQAIDYFGSSGTGLEVAHRDESSLQLRGGGHVTIRVQRQEDTGMTEKWTLKARNGSEMQRDS